MRRRKRKPTGHLCFGRVEIEPVDALDYCTGVGAATSGIANPLTWVQIPVCALFKKTLFRLCFVAQS